MDNSIESYKKIKSENIYLDECDLNSLSDIQSELAKVKQKTPIQFVDQIKLNNIYSDEKNKSFKNNSSKCIKLMRLDKKLDNDKIIINKTMEYYTKNDLNNPDGNLLNLKCLLKKNKSEILSEKRSKSKYEKNFINRSKSHNSHNSIEQIKLSEIINLHIDDINTNNLNENFTDQNDYEEIYKISEISSPDDKEILKNYEIIKPDNSLIYKNIKQLKKIASKKYIENKKYKKKIKYFSEAKYLKEKCVMISNNELKNKLRELHSFIIELKDINFSDYTIPVFRGEIFNNKELFKEFESPIGKIQHIKNLIYMNKKIEKDQNSLYNNDSEKFFKKLKDLLKDFNTSINEENTLFLDLDDEDLPNLSTGTFMSFKKEENNFHTNSISLYNNEIPRINLSDNIDYKLNNSFNYNKIEKRSLKKSSNQFPIYFRNILNDGDSFYRAFMFSLLENHIFYNRKIKLEQLIKIISNKISKKYDDEFNHSIKILDRILKEMKNEMICNAYNILCKAYLLKNGEFDKLLITFAKFICLSFEKNSYDEGINFDFSQLFYLKYIFKNTNIQILFGTKNDSKNLFKFNNSNSLMITLCYVNNTFYPCYTEEMYEKFISIISNDDKNFKIDCNVNEFYYELKEKLICENCGYDSTIHIALINKKKIICKKCLINYINSLLQKRMEIIEEGKFTSIDKLCGAIPIEDYFFLEDYEYYRIFNESIKDTIRKKYLALAIKKCCKCSCLDNTKQLKCGCYYCENCLKKIIQKNTCNYFILNEYEKKFIRKIRCFCGNDMNFSNAVDVYYEFEENEYKKIDDIDESIDRMENYILRRCMYCETEIVFEDYWILKQKTNNKNYKPYFIKYREVTITDNDYYWKRNHKICSKCLNSIKKIKNERNIENINEIECRICCKMHKISIIPFEFNNNIDNNKHKKCVFI